MIIMFICVSIIYFCVVYYHVNKYKQYSKMLLTSYSIGYAIMCLMYGPFVYKEVKSTYRTEMRQYEVVSYSFRGMSKVIIVKDVLTNYTTYVNVCDKAFYSPKDIIMINTKVTITGGESTLSIIDKRCR